MKFINQVLFFLFLLFFCSNNCKSQTRITNESATFEIDNEYFYVAGFYTIIGKANDIQVLEFPLPGDTTLYFNVDSIFIANTSLKQVIKLQELNENYAKFIVQFDQKGFAKLQVLYKQKLKSKQVEYVLSSSEQWNRKNVKANYQLIVPQNLEINFYTINPKNYINKDDKRIFKWKLEEINTQENFVIKFSSN